MERKFLFYQEYGVEEYYIYDPDRILLNGWLRTGDALIPIANMNGRTSPLLKIRFELATGDLAIYCPDGSRFLSVLEMDESSNFYKHEAKAASLREETQRMVATAATQREKDAVQREEVERQRAESERRRAESAIQREKAAVQREEMERQRAESERQRAETESQRAEAERREKERLAARLGELGIET